MVEYVTDMSKWEKWQRDYQFGLILIMPSDEVANPIAKYIVRNCLARLPEYRHVRELEGYEGADGRFRVDFDKPIVRTRKGSGGR